MASSVVILAPRIGLKSETFVGHHVNRLYPTDRTLVVTREVLSDPYWSSQPEVVDLDMRRLTPFGSRRWRIANRIRASLGAEPPKAANPKVVRAIEAALADRPDASVLAEYLDVWALELLEADLGGRRVVVRALGYDMSVRLRSEGWPDVYRRLAKKVLIAPCSEYSRSVLVDAGLDPERLVCVPNGVDVEQFPVRRSRSHEGRLRVLSVGRLVGKKDPRTTIRALRLACDAGVDAELTVAGEGELRPEIEAEIDRLGLADRVRMLGGVRHGHVIDLMQQADVFVQHSVTAASGDEEGMPLSVLEAMATGLPVIGTRHAGIPEVLEGHGYLVHENDADDLAEVMVAIARDREAACVVGLAARHRIEGGYSLDHELDSLRDLLELRTSDRHSTA